MCAVVNAMRFVSRLTLCFESCKCESRIVVGHNNMLDWRSERVQGAPKLVNRVQEESIIGRILLERRKHVVGITKSVRD